MSAFERGFNLGVFTGTAAAAIGFLVGWIAWPDALTGTRNGGIHESAAFTGGVFVSALLS